MTVIVIVEVYGRGSSIMLNMLSSLWRYVVVAIVTYWPINVWGDWSNHPRPQSFILLSTPGCMFTVHCSKKLEFSSLSAWSVCHSYYQTAHLANFLLLWRSAVLQRSVCWMFFFDLCVSGSWFQIFVESLGKRCPCQQLIQCLCTAHAAQIDKLSRIKTWKPYASNNMN